MTDLQSNIPQAIQLVLQWDLPDQALPDAVRTQACLLAHLSSDQVGATDTQD